MPGPIRRAPQVLINCGECTCRILNETRTKLSRVSHLLLTSTDASNVAVRAYATCRSRAHSCCTLDADDWRLWISQGVPSLIFHLSDRGGGDLSVVGPPGTDEYMASIRAFVNRRHPAQHIFPVSPRDKETGGAFRYSTSADDPAPFAWAQAKTPGAGLEIIALPFCASPQSFQSTGVCAGAQQAPPAAHGLEHSHREAELERGAKRARKQQGTAETGDPEKPTHADPRACVYLSVTSSHRCFVS
jgi:hypothetical protein